MPRIAIVGSGFSGLGLGIQLKRQGIDSFTIFEKAGEVGGTWRANTYPGAECDIPSALYSYSFENFDWPNKWSHQPVIKDYLEHCADEYRLRPHIRFHSTVVGIRWDDVESSWDVDVDGPGGRSTERFDVVVSATGQLSRPRYPDIDGLDSFDGPVFHSAEWDHSVDYAGKRIGSIGAGASAVQYVPQVAKTAEQVTIFQRTPNWIIPKNDRDYSEPEKALIRRSRAARNLRRFLIWVRADVLGFDLMKQRSVFRNAMEKYARKNLREKVRDDDKVAKLTPDYPMGAKRVLFSDDYYEAIDEFDVAIETDPIEKVTPGGIVTTALDGTTREHDLDVIVLGTGFHTQDFLTPMEVVGPGGRRLHDEWREGPEAYLGVAVSGYPNLFFMYGPNTNLGHNSIVLMIESQCRYLLSLFTQMASQSIQAVDVKAEVQAAYNAELAERLADSAWVLIEDSWYLQGGKVTNNWVGRTTEYRRRTNHAHLEDFDLTPMPIPATTG